MALKDYLGTITLELLNKESKKHMAKIHYDFAIDINTGIRLNEESPVTFPLKLGVNNSFYGNTLLKEFRGVYQSMKKERMVQVKNILYVNSNIELTVEERTFTLSREKGLLIIL